MVVQPSATDRQRDPGPGWGVAVFLAWLLLVASGFWNLVALPMRAAAAAAMDPAQAAVVERWALASRTPDARVIFDPQACECAEGAARATLLRRIRERGVSIARLPADAARLRLRPELVVFGADDRLRYAGPAIPTFFCTGARHVAETALEAPPGAAALVLPAACRCSTG